MTGSESAFIRVHLRLHYLCVLASRREMVFSRGSRISRLMISCQLSVLRRIGGASPGLLLLTRNSVCGRPYMNPCYKLATTEKDFQIIPPAQHKSLRQKDLISHEATKITKCGIPVDAVSSLWLRAFV